MTSFIRRTNYGPKRFLTVFLFAVLGCETSNNAAADSIETASADVSSEASSDASLGTAPVDGGDEIADTESALENTGWPNAKYVSIDEVYALVQQKNQEMVLINVSDVEFYTMGHIEGSLKIPWDTLEENLVQVDGAKHIVLYCRRGVRSETAYTTLIDAAYPMVWVMEGGLEAWIAAGYPVSMD